MAKMKIEFDTNDPAFYAGLEELMEELSLVETADIEEADRQIKELLLSVFPGAAFAGSVFALTNTGKTALEVFLERLAPSLSAGARECTENLIRQAKKQAADRRKCY